MFPNAGDDLVLMPLIARAECDPETIGIVLHGSRSAGMEDEHSDYDLLSILTDEGYERRAAAGQPLHEATFQDGRKHIEFEYSCPQRLLRRLQAADSLGYLVRTLFALEGRRPPFLDRLTGSWAALGGQGWVPGELEGRFLTVLRDGDSRGQRALEDRVEALMRARGYGDVIDAWEGEIDRVKEA